MTTKTATEITRDLRDFVKVWRSNPLSNDKIYTLMRMEDTPTGERGEVAYELTGASLLEAADKLDAQRATIATMHATMYPAIEDAETKFFQIMEAVQEANSGGLTGDQAVERITEILMPSKGGE